MPAEKNNKHLHVSTSLNAENIDEVTASSLYNEWAFGTLDETLPVKDVEELQRAFEAKAMEDTTEHYGSKLFDIQDCIPLVKEGVQALVNDNFTRCFESVWPEPWNWNIYLYSFWLLGVFTRYCILFPLRLFILLAGTLFVLVSFFLVTTFISNQQSKMRKQRKLILIWARIFVASWSGVIRYHGIRPNRGKNQIHVANHTSLIDVILLQTQFPYAIVGQQHKGGVGFIQDYILKCMGCLWFERNDIKDRQAVSNKIKEHIQNADNNPLLIFPEGTCVNNRYCVMFKKGAFDLDAKIYPIAIKYNKEYCNPFWNSRKESFWKHLYNLMTCWAVVCDVYYLEPQTIRDDETPVQFANRIKDLIAEKAELICVPWDGYLKHLRPSSKFIEHRQRLIVQSMIRKLQELPHDDSPHDKQIEIEENQNQNDCENDLLSTNSPLHSKSTPTLSNRKEVTA